jgi:hypothetical protein
VSDQHVIDYYIHNIDDRGWLLALIAINSVYRPRRRIGRMRLRR